MITDPLITVFFDGSETSRGEALLKITPVVESRGESFIEYHAEITNVSGREIFLEKAELFQAFSLSDYGLEPPYDIFRSGRHKNDLPGVFTTGCRDERLADVAAVMAESGEGLEEKNRSRIVSDHLTLIKGREGKVLAIEFPNGRSQLFETVIRLDDAAEFESVASAALFNILLKPGRTVVSETIRIAETKDVQEEVRAFAGRKAKLYHARSGRRPAVFCTWYYYGLTVSEADVMTCLEIIRRRKLPYDVFQVD